MLKLQKVGKSCNGEVGMFFTPKKRKVLKIKDINVKHQIITRRRVWNPQLVCGMESRQSLVWNQSEGNFTCGGAIHATRDYIRLTAITYQSFGLDRKKQVDRPAFFLGAPQRAQNHCLRFYLSLPLIHLSANRSISALPKVECFVAMKKDVKTKGYRLVYSMVKLLLSFKQKQLRS